MADINAADVAKLREMTGAGMMDCKRALVEAKGNLEAAVDILRKKGQATAAVKSAREAKEGAIAQYIAPNGKLGVLVEVNSETDFVARNDTFRAFCDDAAKRYATEASPNLEAERAALVAKIRENIKVARHARMEVNGNGLIAGYIHTGAKVGVLVEVGAGKAETVARGRIQATRQGYHVANCGGTSACGFPRTGSGGRHRQGTRNRRAIRPFERQTGAGDGENPSRRAGQILSDLLSGGPGLRETELRSERQGTRGANRQAAWRRSHHPPVRAIPGGRKPGLNVLDAFPCGVSFKFSVGRQPVRSPAVILDRHR